MVDNDADRRINLEDILTESGLGELNGNLRRSLVAACYEELEKKVGVELAGQMSDQQLEEFEKVIQSDASDGNEHASKWLSDNFPEYRAVVRGQAESLRGALAERAREILDLARRGVIQ